MKIVHLDFETRSTVDLKKSGAWNYSLDDDTAILCLAYAVNDGPIKLLTKVEIHHHQVIPKDILDADYYVAHNAPFEYAIWNNILHKRLNWPFLPIEKFKCTMAIARANGLPASLDKVSRILFDDLRKDNLGHKLMLQLSKLKMPTKNDPSFWQNNPEKLMALYDYCKKDVEVEREIHKKLGDLIPSERELWLLDQEINLNGIHLDMPMVKKALKMCGIFDVRVKDSFNRLTGLKSPKQTAEVLKFLNSKGENLENLQKNTLEEYKPKTEIGAKVIELRKYLSKSSVAKLKAMLTRQTDGIVRNSFLYHGASTGRWSSVGIQLQNIPRGEVDPEKVFEDLEFLNTDDFMNFHSDVNKSISATLRGMLIPSKGNIFLAGDFAAVEARGNFWLSDEKAGIVLYEKGEDLYKFMASDLYSISTANITKDQRFFGKQLILGAGYGLGHKRFKMMCGLYGKEVDENFAKMAIDKYRFKFNKVVRNWYGQEEMAINAVQYPNKVFKFKKVYWKYCPNEKVLKCLLPSKRILKYWEPQVNIENTPWGTPKAQLSYMGINAVTKAWERERTYGGKIVENIVQAMCRDLLSHCLITLQKEGFSTVLHAHDEIVVESTIEREDEFKRIMKQKPQWAKGFPLDSDTWSGYRYKKD